MSHLMGEFLGTLVLVLLGDGVVANVLLKKSKAENSGWIVISIGWAFAVAVAVIVSLAAGGNGELNPAVTFFKLLAGMYNLSGALITMLAQLLGAFAGAVLLWIHYYPHWKETEDQGLKLACFSTGPAIRNYGANLISEIIGTAILVTGVFAIFSKGMGTLPGGMGPFLVGILVLAIGTCLGGTTGYAINPARDFGPRLAHAILPIAGKGGSDWAYSWVTVVGGFAGAGVAFMVCKGAGVI